MAATSCAPASRLETTAPLRCAAVVEPDCQTHHPKGDDPRQTGLWPEPAARRPGRRASSDLLLESTTQPHPTHRKAIEAPPLLVEPLSQRELAVLRLIAQGLSNDEISERLFLTLDTVKGHNRIIFGKLQVHRRTEAVARARELGLL